MPRARRPPFAVTGDRCLQRDFGRWSSAPPRAVLLLSPFDPLPGAVRDFALSPFDALPVAPEDFLSPSSGFDGVLPCAMSIPPLESQAATASTMWVNGIRPRPVP